MILAVMNAILAIAFEKREKFRASTAFEAQNFSGFSTQLLKLRS